MEPINGFKLSVLHEIANNFDISLETISFLPNNLKGVALLDKRIILIRKGLGDVETINTFFHELAHFHNLETGKFPTYHDPKMWGRNWSQYRTKGFYITAKRAERYTDRLGKKLQHTYFPEIPYRISYL